MMGSDLLQVWGSTTAAVEGVSSDLLIRHLKGLSPMYRNLYLTWTKKPQGIVGGTVGFF